MWELAAQLVPEMVGLVVTPAAVIACLMLLGSSHPFRNVAALGGSFLVVYAVISAAVLAAGDAGDASAGDSARGWVSAVVGVLFLVGGLWSWLRPGHRRVAGSEPGWVARLGDPPLRLVVGLGLVLAVVNPNVAILASGLVVVVTAGFSTSEQAGGVVLLLAASVLDFVVPTLVFVLAGSRGRRGLRRATGWLLDHNHVIGIVVLVVFGLLFIGRGLGQLLG